MVFHAELDVTWKDAITEFIFTLLEVVLPGLAATVDRTREVRFLDKELNEIALTLPNETAEKTQHLEVDMLAELPLMGEIPTIWLLLHIEIQGGGGKKDINRRMYEYHQMIEMKYRQPVVGLLIATEPLKVSGELGKYEWRDFGAIIFYQYNLIKTYELDEAELLKNDNPFSLMLLAALRAWKARKNEREKLEYAKGFVDLLRERCYDEKTIARLLVFMERITRLPQMPKLRGEYVAYVKEKENKGEIPMQMLLIEEMAMERGMARGMEKGKLEGKLETAAQLKRIGIEIDKIVEATGLTRETIERL